MSVPVWRNSTTAQPVGETGVQLREIITAFIPSDWKSRSYQSILRVLIGTAIAVPAVAGLTALLLVLPGPFSWGAIFVGLPMLMAAEHIHTLRWTPFVGGIIMFAGLLSAALLGVLK